MKYRPAVLAVLLLTSACNGDDAPETTTTTTTAAPIESTTSTIGTSGTTTSSTSVPIATVTTSTTTSVAPAPTSEPVPIDPTTTVASDVDWGAVMQTLGQRRQSLYENPDVNRIAEVCGDASPCFDQLNVQLADLADKGWSVVDADPYVVLDATVEAFDGDSLESSLLVTVVAVVQRPVDAGRIVDSAGETVAVVEAETPEGVNTENRTILARTGPTEDPWRIVSQERLREVPA